MGNQLSPEEIVKLRKIIEDDAHATWLRRQIFIVVPVIFAIVSTVIAVGSWLVKNVTLKA